jgi:hypothetical protein
MGTHQTLGALAGWTGRRRRSSGAGWGNCACVRPRLQVKRRIQTHRTALGQPLRHAETDAFAADCSANVTEPGHSLSCPGNAASSPPMYQTEDNIPKG